MLKLRKHSVADEGRAIRIFGDPGVGGLLSDPLEPSGRHQEPDPDAGPPSPDPEPPRHHGDWMPPRKEAPRTRPGPRLAAIMRRKSGGGMPRALFREDDGTSLDDLRALAMTHRQRAFRPLSAGKTTVHRDTI
jgi:hypothetical protein